MQHIVEKIKSFILSAPAKESRLIIEDQRFLRRIERFLPHFLIPILYQSCLGRPSFSRFITQIILIFLANQLITLLVMPPVMAFIVSCVSTLALGFILIWNSKNVWISIFEKKFPSSFGIVADALQSGVPLEVALELAGEEIGEPIREVFSEIIFKLKIGLALDEILENEKRKIDSPDFILFCSSLSIGFSTGGNTSDLIKRLQEIMNLRKQIQMKTAVLTEETKSNGIISMLIPIGVFALICYRSPEAKNFFLYDDRGRKLSLTALALILGNVSVVKVLTRKRTL